MLIVCPSCASRYSINDDKIGANGRTVRCANCRTDFFITLADDRSADVHAIDAPRNDAAKQSEPSAEAPDAGAMGNASPLRPTLGPEPPVENRFAPNSKAADDAPLQVGSVQGLDQVELDALFEAELAAAKQEAAVLEDVADGGEAGVEAEAGAPSATAPVRGWRRLLPARFRSATTSRSSAARAKPATNKSRKTSPARTRKGASHRSSRIRAGLAAGLKGPIALGVVGTLLLAGAIHQREAIVSLAPASANLFAAINLPVNIKGLAFADIRSTTQTDGAARFLIVEGSVKSIDDAIRTVPLIEISLRNEDGRTLYTWTTEPPRSTLKPGEALHFRTRLATPPEAGRQVEVRFTDKKPVASAGS